MTLEFFRSRFPELRIPPPSHKPSILKNRRVHNRHRAAIVDGTTAIVGDAAVFDPERTARSLIAP